MSAIFKVLRFLGRWPKNRHFSVLGKVVEILSSLRLFLIRKKIIKNNGERILALSIAVFGAFVIENCSFFLYFFVNAITSLAIFDHESTK